MAAPGGLSGWLLYDAHHCGAYTNPELGGYYTHVALIATVIPVWDWG